MTDSHIRTTAEAPSATPTVPEAPSDGDAAILDRPGVRLVREALRAAGITGAVRVLPATASSAATAAEQIGCPVGAIANSLIFEADGAPLLVLTSGAHRVDTTALAERIGAARIRRASADLVRAATGQAIGGVAPLGHPAPVRTLVDEALAGYPEIWAAAGHHQTVFPTDFARLVAATGGEVVAVD
ncbi:YbaK/EbsC family protein [Actinospica durhamensis]|uniref:YbaK/EbsC family protein n=1 Tax=Actinospica durhamensis TaxID=1508375 RepID=A0A941EMC5_9ACTN|nr:YbaK/EbsC family protein [Actinospica durhamensis]MBR7834332.1 YbaK/EbsC family protein [Actinospica durhamensis]